MGAFSGFLLAVKNMMPPLGDGIVTPSTPGGKAITKRQKIWPPAVTVAQLLSHLVIELNILNHKIISETTKNEEFIFHGTVVGPRHLYLTLKKRTQRSRLF
jgi:hypothetical protein